MTQSDDDYGIYRRPSASTLAAVVCAGAALFFGSWAMQLKKALSEDLRSNQARAAQAEDALAEKERMVFALNDQVRELQDEVKHLRERLDAANAVSLAPAPRPAAPVAAAPLTPAPLAVAPQAPVVAKVETPAASAAVVAAPAAPKMPAAPVVVGQKSGGKAAEIALPEAVKKAAPAEVSRKDKPEIPEKTEKNAEDLAADLAAANTLSGEILTYSPDNQRAYLSLGSANGGVQPGNRFSVWRGGEYVADIEVMKVFSVTSTCKVTGDATGLQVGDIARRARPALGRK